MISVNINSLLKQLRMTCDYSILVLLFAVSLFFFPSVAMSTESAWSFNHREFSHYFAFFHEIVPDGTLLAGQFTP